MNIIQPSFDLIRPQTAQEGVEQLRFIERMARISHRMEDKQTIDSWQKFIPAVVMGHGDWSVVEHASATVIFRIDRGCTHELVRHRLFSFTQESTRFVNYQKKGEIEVIAPELSKWTDFDWESPIALSLDAYDRALTNGWRPQEARSLLPNALASTIAVTGNLRSWRWIFLARTTQETHPDFRRVMIPLLKVFQDRIPLLYNDITPMEKQSVSMARVH
jgi:thymidylate synthase (FAD)